MSAFQESHLAKQIPRKGERRNTKYRIPRPDSARTDGLPLARVTLGRTAKPTHRCPPRLGYASFEPEFADMVRSGKASRRFWRNVFEMLEYSAKTGWMLDAELTRIVRELDLTREDIGLVRSA